MRNQPKHPPVRATSLLLWALPAILGCPLLGRTAEAGGDVEGVPELDATSGAVRRSSADLTSPPAAAARTPDRTVLTGSPDGVVAPSTTAPRSTSSNAPTNEDLAVLTEVNRLRALRSLAPMRFDARLFVAARAHSEEQLSTNYLGHGSADPERAKLSQRLTQGGYVGRMYAEVVAQNYADAVSVVAAWMESPTHRAVLLDPDLTEGAFCRISNAADPRVNRWTGDFGAPVTARVAVPQPATATATPRSQPLTPPAASKVSLPANPAPRSQPLPVAASRPAAQPAPKLATPSPSCANGNCSGGKCGVPAPTFGSASGVGGTLPAPRVAPGIVVPSTAQPAYAPTAPVPYRAPVIRRPSHQNGNCRT